MPRLRRWTRRISTAFLEEPIEHPDGRVTCISDSKCLPYFAVHHGCSVCVAVCPFHKVAYDELKHSVEAASA